MSTCSSVRPQYQSAGVQIRTEVTCMTLIEEQRTRRHILCREFDCVEQDVFEEMAAAPKNEPIWECALCHRTMPISADVVTHFRSHYRFSPKNQTEVTYVGVE